jgi:hypothetical protein
MPASHRSTTVIPGHAEGMSPEPRTAGVAGKRRCSDTVVSVHPAVLGSGLFAARSPGMTAEVPTTEEG